MAPNLRLIRRAADLTQAQMATRWGRAQSQVARIENAPLQTATLRTVVAYVRAAGGTCRLTVDIEGQHLDFDLSVAPE